ncbi:hypothetical protein EZS27_029417 [termite gut metagenome]|uniref:Uncharacterized protein n=1 Tax=termite gut metagenome TaxID=433724 RepID=A0A5J4QGF4_9ZZZZ
MKHTTGYLIILYKTSEDYQHSNKNVSIFVPYNKQIIRMRIRSLLVIASVFLASWGVVSCLDLEEDVFEYSSDDTIHAFALDTVYGVNYAFTIDQIKGKIFNRDSMPVGADTIINKILITKLEIMGYVLTGDSLLDTSDSLDLSKTMEKPLQLKIVAPDGEYTKEYEVEVRVHRQEPDSLVWTKMTSSFSTTDIPAGRPKPIILDNKIFVYTPTLKGKVYWALLSKGDEWKDEVVIGLPDNADLGSMLTLKNRLYVVTADDKVLVSEDGLSWNEDERLNGQGVESLIGSFPNVIVGIKHDAEGKKFFTVSPDLSEWKWEVGDAVSSLFPIDNFSFTVYKTKTGIWKAFMTGDVGDETKPVSLTPWFSLDGLRWTAAEAPVSSDEVVSYSCPYMQQPSIMRYDDKFYAFGDGFDAFYVSKEGITWSEVKKLVLFPEDFKGRSDYSVVIDKDNYIWVVWGEAGEVWRGRMNKFGFDIK